MERIKTFVKESWAELGKITWPNRQELAESTVVVIVSVILITIFIGLVDLGFSNLLKLFARTV
ncbi:MAG TPA: preprotein translocase subunit SecE [Candidatus Krumholzibacteria bacterium]|jgi:preprotein translocase subunit SecE|nr:preprotein translocase subunit SecE [Candidatus Krumholzibacteria bacterium]